MTAGALGPARQGAASQAEEGPRVDALDPAGQGHRRPRLPAESREGLLAGAAVRRGLVGFGQSGDSLDGREHHRLRITFLPVADGLPRQAEQAWLPPAPCGLTRSSALLTPSRLTSLTLRLVFVAFSLYPYL